MARISSRIMFWSFGLAMLCWGGMVIWSEVVMAILSAAAFAVALVAGAVRLACSIFAESQVRLAELMLCVVTVGALTTAFMALSPRDMDPEERPFAVVVFLAISSLLVAAGAARGWTTIRKKGETRAGVRLLLVGWGVLQAILALVGIIAVISGIILLIIFLVRRNL